MPASVQDSARESAGMPDEAAIPSWPAAGCRIPDNTSAGQELKTGDLIGVQTDDWLKPVAQTRCEARHLEFPVITVPGRAGSLPYEG